ncbi:uncharacterized protein FMAN_13476 [Fusarium mangiferae]|uniref:Uncharacterized protein n=1 Tax=Fusarium mangiferae TaxID=192010 RepID=A0A1L7TJC0_FUSMA|nr:uncharacterized protein FMAN_13476 [Fusarium mangiferae]CVK95377.1 uncharacterized protein FMAN_13476 [Fusarium mangiferae]
MDPPRIPPVNVEIDELNWFDIQRKIYILNAQVNFLRGMLRDKEEILQRNSPRKTERAMQAFALTRRPEDDILQAKSRVRFLMMALVGPGDFDRPRMQELLAIAERHLDLLHEEGHAYNEMMNRYLIQMEMDQMLHDEIRHQANVLRGYITQLVGEVQRLQRTRLAIAA